MRESIHSNTSPNTMLLVCHNGLFNDEFPFNKKDSLINVYTIKYSWSWYAYLVSKTSFM